MNEAIHYAEVDKQKQIDLDLAAIEPKPVSSFVPEDAAEQKAAFISGEIVNPDHSYDKLADIDFDARADALEALLKEVNSGEGNPKYVPVYTEFIQRYIDKNRFMQVAKQYKESTDPAEKQRLADEYMRLNVELYGEPERETFQSIIAEKIQKINSLDLSGRASDLRSELVEMLGSHTEGGATERFKPSAETIAWVKNVAESLYGGMLSHLPGKESFSKEELQSIFTEIITEEFGEAAADWRVDIEPAGNINVKATEKRVVIPDKEVMRSRDMVRSLIVHELGVHMLRAVRGGETDLGPFSTGFVDYYDAEEGLGVVMEQAIKGEYREAGLDHYVTAGLAYFDGMDFRHIFEIKWRLGVLSKIKDSEDVTDELIAKQKELAYGATMRIFRGTDELPWFKDLAYFNGARDTWKHLESIRGDDLKFTFVLLGKADPSNIKHERIMYETRTME